MAKDSTIPEFIESTAGRVAAELARRGIAPDQPVTITIEPREPDDWIAKARKFSRPKVIAEGWSDEGTRNVRPFSPVSDEAGRRYQRSHQRRADTGILARQHGSLDRPIRRPAQKRGDRAGAVRGAGAAARGD
jgi:hypothetical protein